MSTLAEQIACLERQKRLRVGLLDDMDGGLLDGIISSLRSIEAQSDEVRRLREVVIDMREWFGHFEANDADTEKDVNQFLERFDEVLGSQP